MAKKSRDEAAEELGLVSQPDERELESLRPSERRKIRESYGSDRKANKRKMERSARSEYGRSRKGKASAEEKSGRPSRAGKTFGKKKRTGSFGNSRRDSGRIHSGKKR